MGARPGLHQLGAVLVAATFGAAALALPKPVDATGVVFGTDRLADDFNEADFAPRPFRWTGPYAAIFGGYGQGVARTRNEPGPGGGDGFDEGGALTLLESEPDGAFGGVNLGYNLQAGRTMLGIDFEAGWLGGEAARSEIVNGDNFARSEFGAYGLFALRGGWVQGRTFLFGKFGLGVAEIETAAGDLIDGTRAPTAADRTQSDDLAIGYVVGGGIEHAFADNWSLRTEYLFFDFGQSTSSNAQGDTFAHDHALHTFKVGLSYRF